MKHLVLFGLVFFSACRSGHFEDRSLGVEESRVLAELLSSEFSSCKESDENFCRVWNGSLSLFDRVDRAQLAPQDWSFRLYNSNIELLEESSASVNQDSELSWTTQIEIPKDHQFIELVYFIEFEHPRYESLKFRAVLNFSEDPKILRSFERIQDFEQSTKLSQTSRELELVILGEQVLGVEMISTKEEKINYEVSAQIQDKATGVGLAAFALRSKIVDLSTGESFESNFVTDSDAGFKMQFSLSRPRFSHESQKKLRLDLHLDSKVFQAQLSRFLIVDVDARSDQFIRHVWTLNELLEEDEWRNQSRRYASQKAPRLVMDRVEVVELNLAEPWRITESLDLIFIEKFVFDFSLLLERSGFSETQKIDLDEERIKVRMGVTELESGSLRPVSWTQVEETNAQTSSTGEYSAEYITETVISSPNSVQSPWFLIETSLRDHSIVPASFHLIRWPSPFFKNLDRAEVSLSSTLSNEESKPKASHFIIGLNELPPDLSPLVSEQLLEANIRKSRTSRADARKIFDFLRSYALKKGQAVRLNANWTLLTAYEVFEILDQRQNLESEATAEANQLNFELYVRARPCLSFAAADQVLSICQNEEHTTNVSLHYHLVESPELRAYRLLKPGAVSDQLDLEYLLDSYVFYPLLEFR